MGWRDKLDKWLEPSELQKHYNKLIAQDDSLKYAQEQAEVDKVLDECRECPECRKEIRDWHGAHVSRWQALQWHTGHMIVYGMAWVFLGLAIFALWMLIFRFEELNF